MSVSVAELIVRLNDQASGKAGQVAAALGKIAASEKAIAAASPELRKLTDELTRADAALKKIGDFRQAQQGFAAARQTFREAQENVRQLARQMAEAEKPTRELQNSFRRAQAAVKAASADFDRQKAAVLGAKNSLSEYGIGLNQLAGAEGRLRSSIDATTAAMKRQAAVERSAMSSRSAAINAETARRAVIDGGGGIMPFGGKVGAVAVGAYGVKRAHDAVIDQHHDFQRATLYQRAMLGMTPDQQAPLQAQAFKIGQDTIFSNADIVKAQSDIGGKLPDEFKRADIIAPITEATKNYSLAMQVSMEEGAKAVVGRIKALGYDVSSPNAAEASARKAANRLVQLAKMSGAKHHDLVHDTSYGAAPARVGGFSEEFANAMTAQLIRLGYDGHVAGTFVRAAASKLSVPSLKGRAAIASAGLDFNQYVTPGTDFSSGGLAEMLKQRFGRGLDQKHMGRIDELFSDESVVANRGTFIEKVSSVLNEVFAKRGKKGDINAQDAERIAKTVDQFYTVSQKGTDTERLMTDLMKRGITTALATYLFGQEQGGRATGLNADQLTKDVESLRKTPDDRAQKIAESQQAGAQGAYNQMIGSMQTFAVTVGEATDGLRTFTYNLIGGTFDALSKLIKAMTTPSAVGDAIRGKNWQPKEGEDLANTETEMSILRQRIAQNKANSRNPEALAMINSPLEQQLADLRNRSESARKAGIVPDYGTGREEGIGRAMMGKSATFGRLPAEGAQAGQEAGQAAGLGIASGLASQQGPIAAQVEAIRQEIVQKLSNIPVNIKVNTPSIRGIQSDVGVGQ